MNERHRSRTATLHALVAMGFATLAGCAPAPMTDAAADTRTDAVVTDNADVPVMPCASDDDCADGLFCNGRETCRPGTPSADRRGCAPAASPACAATDRCDESADRCLGSCADNGDADHDGHISIDCPGGDDCDDTDPQRFPGNTEICDSAGHDEDCNSASINNRDRATGNSIDGDADGDGAVSSMCCNTRRDGGRTCGTDCNDTAAATNPFSPEVCDGIDNDCDGTVDDGLPVEPYFPDCDGDMFGDPWGAPISGCTPPTTSPPCVSPAPTAGWSAVATDCDDTDGGRNAGVSELCDGVDNDCNGVIDDGGAADHCPTAPNASRMACWLGRCLVASCRGGFGDCDGANSNGCEVDLATSDANCGSCGATCGFPNGSGRCLGASCTLASCNSGFHGCGGECVENLSLAHCGSSCAPCVSPANGSVTCDGSTCISSCDPGFHLCGVNCAADESPDHCGRRCDPCPAPPPNGIATCTAGVCGFECATNFFLWAGSCLRGPRLVGPISGSLYTSARPVFRWSPVPGSDGTRIEICRERSCATVVTSFDSNTSTGSAAIDLPPATYFWRARALNGTIAAPPSAHTWQLRVVGRVSGPGVMYGLTFDRNGDGASDLYFYYALYPGPFGSTAPAGQSLTLDRLGPLGDVNGDGFPDLTGFFYSGEAFHIYHGSANPFVESSWASTLVALPVGDVNGDGYGDIDDRANIRFGTSNGIVASDPSTAVMPGVLAGDFDGDGVWDTLNPAYRGPLAGYLGNHPRPLGDPDFQINAEGENVAVGDLDGDGSLDIALGGFRDPLRIYPGPWTRWTPTTAPSAVITSPSLTGSVGVSDMNGDGLDDVVVGIYTCDSSGFRCTPGGAIFHGRPTGIPNGAAPDTMLSGIGPGDYNYRGDLLTGDYNADGIGDLVMIGESGDTAYVFFGRTGGLGANATPAYSLP